ncbi:ATP-dependent DNA helicase PIF1-like protein [Tanacetum coccineum]|uniref:ATP-dependent DNA helicase n=1 Tax=Tanacetum coccineum TaxID=301880 RepID=A0ABQ5IAE1_9ASTR
MGDLNSIKIFNTILYDPLSYVLCFLNGEPGWHPKFLRVGASMNEIVDEDENIDPCLEGTRDMRRRILDAMSLVQDDGNPDIFLTMTCNPKWSEILEALNPSLLHAHFLLIMTLQYKMSNLDDYEKMVCAEIPDPKYQRMHEMVVKHMMHGPCGHLRTSSLCMEGEPKQSHWRYPRKFIEKTAHREDSYPLYQRKNTKAEVNSQLHLLNMQLVRFQEDDTVTDIVERERHKKSMLTTFFRAERVYPAARQYLYREIPSYFTWNAHSRCFKDLNKVNGALFTTFQKATLERGLIENDSLSHCLFEASLFQFPNALRRLFMTILIIAGLKMFKNYRMTTMNHFLKTIAGIEKIPKSVGLREVHEEYSIVVKDEHQNARDSLNHDQKVAYDNIVRHVDKDCPGLMALATASLGAVANNMPEGRTTHSRFKIPINFDKNSMCNITKQSGLAELLRLGKLIIWDEAIMAKTQAVEAVDQTMQDIKGVIFPFGFIKMQLTMNMRAQVDPWFSDFLLRVDNGVEEAIDGSYIRIPDDMAIPYTNDGNSRDDLINAIFPSLETNEHSSAYIISRAILPTKNENVVEINDQLIGRFHGEEKS